jgi:tRNA(fMet)-specific endonuclease VapC
VTRYLLDTNICIELLRAGSPAMLARMREHEIDAIAISAITLAELNCGVAKSSRPEHHASLLAQFCAAIDVLPFDHLAAETYGRNSGGRIRTCDLRVMSPTSYQTALPRNLW